MPAAHAHGHHGHHEHHHQAHGTHVIRVPGPSLARMAFFATLHCLAGCAVGEVLGLVLGTALGWGNGLTTVVAVLLAFAFGYAFTALPLRRQGLPWRDAARLALAADTASIAVMEVVDNGVMWLLPGAMDATLAMPQFWGAMVFSLAVALLVAWPLNGWLLARGRGHALVHGQHAGHGAGH